ncbi:hypothetical protein [Flavobacterium psychrotrophum]|uniref:hypothetical protein n=1 Tax=Flavobacterium psychrotrophum TaxID=2294119 RepID=UPI0013C53A43|nr:hypothetical protein [Flavobacterium psychrotrophum]
MKIIRPLFAVLVLLLAASCGNKTETVTAKHYSIDVPSFLQKTKGLNDAASLQYKSEDEEFYLLVIDEPRKAFEDLVKENALGFEPNLDGYSGILLESLEEGAHAEVKPVLKPVKINGLTAKVTSLIGSVANEKIYWKIAYIEGKSRYYQVLCWTSPEKQPEFESVMDEIINSFKEVGK